MKIKGFTIIITLMAISTYCCATTVDTVYTKADSIIYESCIKSLHKYKKPSITDVAKQFLGKPYIASTLEVRDKEDLIINLRELDCTTFVETCIAIHLAKRSGNPSFSNYCKKLSDIRYRNGEINGYPSRLHYMTDWTYENQKNGVLEDISLQLGGEIIYKPINYMTTHTDSYKYLRSDKLNVEKMKIVEEDINGRNSYRVIPVNKIADTEKNIKDGDIILFATTIEGLDYSHVGIAYYKKDGQLSFIHASSKGKKVLIESKSLVKYCQSSKICSGITVLRLH